MQRRDALRTLLAFSLPGSLVACGGGGGGGGSQTPLPTPEAAPQITQFSSDKTEYFIGEPATFSASFDKGTATFGPAATSIVSGVPVTLPYLAADRLTLLVRSRSAVDQSVFLEAKRELQLSLKYRNQWKAMDAGFLRAAHVTVQGADGTVYVIGGEDGSSTLSQTVMHFNPLTEKFSTGGTLSTGRTQHTATALKGDGILIFGGFPSVQNNMIAELYIPSTSKSRAPAGQPKTGRRLHAATLLNDGSVLLTGGQAPGEAAFSGTADLYNPVTEQFTRLTAQMKTPRIGHSASLLADGKVLIVGGTNSTNGALPPEVFDPATNTFTSLPAVPGDTLPHVRQVALKAASGDLLVIGGEDWFDGGPYDGIQRFVKGSNAGALVGKLIVPRTAHSGANLLDGRMLVAGGVSGLVSTPVATVDIYNPANGTIAAGPAMSTARMYHTADLLITGKVLVIGGNVSPVAISGTAELFA